MLKIRDIVTPMIIIKVTKIIIMVTEIIIILTEIIIMVITMMFGESVGCAWRHIRRFKHSDFPAKAQLGTTHHHYIHSTIFSCQTQIILLIIIVFVIALFKIINPQLGFCQTASTLFCASFNSISLTKVLVHYIRLGMSGGRDSVVSTMFLNQNIQIHFPHPYQPQICFSHCFFITHTMWWQIAYQHSLQKKLFNAKIFHWLWMNSNAYFQTPKWNLMMF